MNTQRDITKSSHLLEQSVESKHSAGRSRRQYVMANRFSSNKEKKMSVSKTLASIVGACLIPITGLVFMQEADAGSRWCYRSNNPKNNKTRYELKSHTKNALVASFQEWREPTEIADFFGADSRYVEVKQLLSSGGIVGGNFRLFCIQQGYRYLK